MNRTLQQKLIALQDASYAAFQIRLIPGVAQDSVIGVRVPLLRKLAKDLVKEDKYEAFLRQLPHEYYDENVLHGLVISQVKCYAECISRIEAFLPYVDNWAVCDLMNPKVLAKHKDLLIEKIRTWCDSLHTYTCRFGIRVLMSYYLDEDFKATYLEIVAKVQNEAYYVRMMVAWFFATALSKQWEATVPFIEQRRLTPWVHNKTIQKAIESYRITPEQKAYLRTLKMK